MHIQLSPNSNREIAGIKFDLKAFQYQTASGSMSLQIIQDCPISSAKPSYVFKL